MHTGGYGILSTDGRGEPGGRPVAWPVRSGQLPSLAEGFTTRPDTAPGLEAELLPGTAVALVPGQAAVPGQVSVPGQPPVPGQADVDPGELTSSGKTQLAAYFAEALWRSGGVELLAWVAATSRGSVLSGYVQAAAAAGMGRGGDAEAVAARFTDWLAKTSRPWLIVLDDLRDGADLEGLWPAGPAGRLLITTADAATVSGGHRALALSVPALSSREAMAYLASRLSTDPDQRSGAIDLVSDLGCEPTALAQASAVIASSSLTCRDYRHHFNQRRDQIAAAGGNGTSAAAITWTFSAEYAEHLSRGAGVRPLLALAALLDGHAIPSAVFSALAMSEYLAGDGPALPPDPRRAWTVLNSLRQAGLLAIDAPGTPPTIRITSVVQAAIRAAIPPAIIERAVRAAADALLEVWPRDEPQSWLAAELRSCVASLRQAGTDPLWTEGRCPPLLLVAGQSLDGARLTGPAVAYWRELAADSERLLGPASPETLMVNGHLGEALLTAGQPAEAASWFERVVHGRASVLGPDHPDTVAAGVWLGRAIAAVGQADDAVAVLTDAVADSERVRGSDHVDTLTAREEYAAACRAAGKAAEAIRTYRHLLADRERLQGPRHPETMTTNVRLADAYLAGGQPKDAIAQYKQALADREAVLGADHPDTLAARSGLAAANFSAGRMGPALQLYEETGAAYERAMGADHPSTLACQAALARAYYAAGRLGDALGLLTDTIARSERALPQGDPLTQSMRESLQSITG